MRQQELGNQNTALRNIQQETGIAQRWNFDVFKNNPYASPAYQERLRSLAMGATEGGTNNAQEDLQNYARRSGTNSANLPATEKEIARDNTRTMVNAQAGKFASDYGDWQKMRMGAADNENRLASTWSPVFGAAGSDASGALQQQTELAKQPGFWSKFGGKLLGAGVTAAGAFTGNPALVAAGGRTMAG